MNSPESIKLDQTLFWSMVAALRLASDEQWKLTACKRTETKFAETLKRVEELCQTLKSQSEQKP